MAEVRLQHCHLAIRVKAQHKMNHELFIKIVCLCNQYNIAKDIMVILKCINILYYTILL